MKQAIRKVYNKSAGQLESYEDLSPQVYLYNSTKVKFVSL